jgi:hypothetical protein
MAALLVAVGLVEADTQDSCRCTCMLRVRGHGRRCFLTSQRQLPAEWGGNKSD